MYVELKKSIDGNLSLSTNIPWTRRTERRKCHTRPVEIIVTVIFIYLTAGRFSGERIIHCERERERGDFARAPMTILTRVFITREGTASRVNHAGDGINLANSDAA